MKLFIAGGRVQSGGCRHRLQQSRPAKPEFQHFGIFPSKTGL